MIISHLSTCLRANLFKAYLHWASTEDVEPRFPWLASTLGACAPVDEALFAVNASRTVRFETWHGASCCWYITLDQTLLSQSKTLPERREKDRSLQMELCYTRAPVWCYGSIGSSPPSGVARRVAGGNQSSGRRARRNRSGGDCSVSEASRVSR